MRNQKQLILPPSEELQRLGLVVRRSGAALRLDDALRAPGTKGRRREASAELFLVIAVVLLSVRKAVRAADVRAMIDSGEVEEVRNALDAMPGLRRGNPPAASRAPITIHQWNRFWSDVARLPYAEVFEVANLLLLAWLPVPAPLGNLLLFDATAYETHARPLPKDVRQQLLREGSTDLLLKRERKLPRAEQETIRRRRTHRAHEANFGHATKTRKQAKSTIGGFHLHPVTSSDGEPAGGTEGGSAPTCVVAVDVTPAAGYSSPEQLKSLLRFVRSRYEISEQVIVIADRDYSKRFEIWAWLRGQHQPFAFDLRAEQLEPRGEHQGALLAQGNALCCATPRHLRNPGRRPMTTVGDDRDPNPEYADWLARVREQSAYRCHVKSVRPHGVNVSCPALGPSPTVDCLLRSTIDPHSPRPVVLDPPAPHTAPSICKQQTVFIPDSANPLRQTYRWGTARWIELYQRARARNEGVHGELKHPQGYGLAGEITGSSRRNVVAIHAALVMSLFNYDKIWEFLETNPDHPFCQAIAIDALFI